MYVTTVMVVLLIGWCGVDDPEAARDAAAAAGAGRQQPGVQRGRRRVDAAADAALAARGAGEGVAGADRDGIAAAKPPHYASCRTPGALLGLIGILMAFGHSFLAMSGEESLAQVNRELDTRSTRT